MGEQKITVPRVGARCCDSPAIYERDPFLPHLAIGRCDSSHRPKCSRRGAVKLFKKGRPLVLAPKM